MLILGQETLREVMERQLLVKEIINLISLLIYMLILLITNPNIVVHQGKSRRPNMRFGSH